MKGTFDNPTTLFVKDVSGGQGRVMSRAQAKRLLDPANRSARLNLDFTGIETIGQGFADEVFRVFKNAHPEVEVLYTGANPEVEKMILRAKATHVGR